MTNRDTARDPARDERDHSLSGIAASIAGTTIFLVGVFTILAEFGLGTWAQLAASAGTVVYLVVATPQVGWSRRVFVIAGLVLLVAAISSRENWLEITGAALRTGAFVGGFFVALACLRNAAATSEAIARCGTYLAEQPPGRRYLALTAGGHLFSLILSYGAISLLGTLAATSAATEADEQIRVIRRRRMLLAIQRGFVAMLCWSPLGFAMAISTSIVPNTSWSGALLPCVVSSLILAALGWTIDTMYKPPASVHVPPRKAASESWRRLIPLFILLALLVVGVVSTKAVADLRAVAAVMVVVPLIGVGWIYIQLRGGETSTGRAMMHRVGRYITEDLPGYRSELVLLIMAGFIGTLGGRLVAPLVERSGIDFDSSPAWIILVALVWLIPIAGQLGMNPILFVSLAAPLLPHADALGVPPASFIVAITAGWALSGASSPYTATTMLVGSLGNVSAFHVGARWNGPYTVLGAVLLSLWVVAFAYLWPDTVTAR